jgi:hypothetical protein
VDGQGCYVGVADRKMTHETKEDEGDQWTGGDEMRPVRVSRGGCCLHMSYN